MLQRSVFLAVLIACSITLTTQTSTSIAQPEPETTPQPEVTFASVQEPTTTPDILSISEPDTSSPEISSGPEVSTPESESQPETSIPESEPDTSSPEISSEPEVSTPESESQSEISIPESEPGTTSPETELEPATATSETRTEPETSVPETSAPETGSEPETTAPETETSSPETGSEPESPTPETSTPKIVSEPESGPEASSPEIGPETEPKTSLPEALSEKEITSPKPESEPEILKPETESQPEISNPETGTAQETGSEPHGSSPESGPEPEQVSTEPETPKSESGSEPEASTNQTENGKLAEPESSGEPENTKSEPEVTLPGATGEPEKTAQAEIRPSPAEIVLPPFMLMMVIVLGLLALLARTRYTAMQKSALTFSRSFIRNVISNSSKFGSLKKSSQIQMTNIDNNNEDDKETSRSEESFFTPFDFEVMDSLKNSYNRPKELFTIALPALLSLALCPFTLYLYEPVTKFLWPVDEHPAKPDINDAIACFLAPAGLVYATSFGFAFQSAISKQHEILMKMTEEISMIDQIATFTAKLKLPSQKLRMEVYRAIKTEAIFMILQILDRDVHTYKNKAPPDLKVRIWSVLDTLRTVNTSKHNHVDRCLSEKIMCHIMRLNSICSDRMGVLHARIHPVKWMFLETLGFFSFVGILLLNAYSYKMELLMCIITVFSISMLCYVVSDLDSPFSGFFRVDLSVMYEVIERLSAMHELAKLGETGFIFYPERGNSKGKSLELSRPSTAELATDKIIKDCW